MTIDRELLCYKSYYFYQFFNGRRRSVPNRHGNYTSQLEDLESFKAMLFTIANGFVKDDVYNDAARYKRLIMVAQVYDVDLPSPSRVETSEGKRSTDQLDLLMRIERDYYTGNHVISWADGSLVVRLKTDRDENQIRKRYPTYRRDFPLGFVLVSDKT